MPTRNFAIQPQSPFHLGNGPQLSQVDLFPRSDTLVSALIATAVQLGMKDWVETIRNDETFRVSSLFPKTAGGPDLVPFPCHYPGRSNWIENLPRIEDANWIDRDLLGPLFNQGITPETVSKVDSIHLSDGILYETTEEKSQPVLVEERQVHNTLDRATEQAVPYQVSQTHIRDGFFQGWITGAEESLSPMPTLFERLGQKGLGGERSRGFGKFTFRDDYYQDVTEELSEGDPSLLISVCWPGKDDLDQGNLEQARFRTDIRGGWFESNGINSGRRKRSLRVLKEGAVLPNVPKTLGSVRDVSPQGFDRHPVWRWGRAFLIGVNQ